MQFVAVRPLRHSLFMTDAFHDWAQLGAPTLADIEGLADAAFASLPASFTRLCEGVVFHVEDFPDDETMDEMSCETEFDLLGLFRGRGLTDGAHLAETGAEPNMVYLYRRPILDYWCESEDTLGDIVTHVLVHEIGHHFGLSDEEMEAIERGAAG
jgi:predicted Zn-dependent protease with MMP-like domain